MKSFCRPIEVKGLACAAITAVASQTALADVIFEPTDLGGGSWQYDIEVVNTQGFQVDGVRLIMPHSIFPSFPDTGFSNLTEIGQPVGNWFSTISFEIPSLLAQSYWVLNDSNNGVPAGFDSVLTPGETMTGISLTFDWVGDPTVVPSAFDWEFIFLDPATGGTIEVLASGRAREKQAPVPGTLALLAIGLVGAGLRGSRR